MICSLARPQCHLKKKKKFLNVNNGTTAHACLRHARVRRHIPCPHTVLCYYGCVVKRTGMETRAGKEGENTTSLLFSSDFCDFEDSALPTHPERFVSAVQLVGGVW